MGTYFRSQILRRETTGLMFPIERIIKTERDIGKKLSLGCHLISFRYGDHTLGFHVKGRERIALVFARPHFFVFQY